MQALALIKLGGSVVTHKERALAANEDAIARISLALSRVSMPMIIVHGGGSFGHYWSVRYDMHTKPDEYDSQGIAIVHESMVRLNQIIVNSMIQKGLNAYSVPPASFTEGTEPMPSKVKELFTMAHKILPVTFGDVVHVEGRKFGIMSGDAIMTMLAKTLKPSRVIFATNVDGIYEDVHSKKLVGEIKPSESKNISFATTVADVTGGMQRKVQESQKIASLGLDVTMVNGLEPQRIVDAAEGKKVVGTVFLGKERA